MRTKVIKQILVIAGIISGIALVFNSALAQEQDSFSFQPPESTEIRRLNYKFGGRDFAVIIYDSALLEEEIIEHYLGLFADQEFVKIFDEEFKTHRLLRFRKGDLVIGVGLTPKEGRTNVGIVQYIQPPGAPPPEKLKPTWEDIVGGLPKLEQAGEDIPSIPPPPESKRFLSTGDAETRLNHYKSSLEVSDVREFYEEIMPSYGWHLSHELSLDKAAREYEALTGKRSFGMPLPIEGVTLQDITKGGYRLNYVDKEGAKAQILIINFDPHRRGGSMVQIRYYEEK